MSKVISASPTPPSTADAAAAANDNNKIPRVFETMTAMTNHFVTAWDKSAELRALKHERLMIHYGWSSETIASFKIGFDDGTVVEHLRANGFTRADMIATGSFYIDSYNAVVSRFSGRIVFPYLDDKGTTLYFTARQTVLTPPWMKDGKDGAPKYVKTKVHVETKKGDDDDGISPLVTNVIWRTHEQPKKQKLGIIAEGMPDAISAAQAGYPVRSPVTTAFKESDADIIDELISGWDAAVLIPDMEQNESGIKGALKTSKKLIEKGRDIRIAILPHDKIKANAEARVEELRKQKIAEGRTATDDEIKKLGDWKIDLNEFLAAPVDAKAVTARFTELRKCSTPEDEPMMKQAKTVAGRALSALRAERKEALRVLVKDAKPALNIMIDRLPKEPTPADFGTIVTEVTGTIALIKSDSEREAWLDKLKLHVGGRLTVLRSMVEEEQDEDEPENPVTPILAGMRFFRILTGRVFTVVNGQALPVDGEEFASFVAQKCFEKTKKVIGPTMIKDATRAVVGVTSKLPVGIAPIRYAYDLSGNGIWIDLADKDGPYVHVTKEKIGIEEHSPIAFYRPAGTGAMPVPEIIVKDEECIAVLGDYFTFLAIDKKSRAGLFAVIMSAMRPMEHPQTGALTRYAVGVFNGEHGSGKSTRQMFVRRTIDSREPASMKMPDKTDDLIIYCENSAVVSLDNQSMLSETMSDALCRVATGDGNVKRSLYTSRDLSIFRGSRPIFVNGITDVVTRDDLLDRSLIVHVEKPETGKTDDELEGEFKALLPRVFGALLLCMQDALIHESSTEVERSIRMLQAARWAAAAEITAGFEPGDVEHAYLAAREEAVAIAADDPFVTAILALLRPGTEWKGTMTELTRQLVEHVEERDDVTGKPTKKAPKDFPTTVPKVRSMLKRKQPALRALGLGVERRSERTDKSSNATIITLVRKLDDTPKPEAPQPNTNRMNGSGYIPCRSIDDV